MSKQSNVVVRLHLHCVTGIVVGCYRCAFVIRKFNLLRRSYSSFSMTEWLASFTMTTTFDIIFCHSLSMCITLA